MTSPIAGAASGAPRVNGMEPGERRHVTILFADLCGYTKLNERFDPEEIAPLMAELRARVDQIARRFGGAVNEWRGDGVLCVFGLPDPTESDARHALEATLELHASVRQLELPSGAGLGLRMHSGIESGLVYVRAGDLQRGRYELIGDAVNTAARLCSAAREDEIFASESTLRGIEEFFETDSIEPLVLRGKRSLVRARKIRGRSGITTRFGASRNRGLTPLVGRDAALARLAAHWQAALLGERRVLQVIGVPGIGKTRLLEEFRARVHEANATVSSGYCEAGASATPLQPFLQILARLHETGVLCIAGNRAGQTGAQTPEPLLAPHAGLLLGLLGSDTPAPQSHPEARQLALVAAFDALFATLSARGPLLLLLDDWQWSDDTARQILADLMRTLLGKPALIVLAQRGPSDSMFNADDLIEVAPFTAQESESAIRCLVPHTFDAGLNTALHRRSGGNPLYLEQLCGSVAREAPATQEDLIERVPSTLNGLIRSRVDRLPARSTTLLRAAAVLGNDFSLTSLQRLAMDLVPAVAREELLESEFVYEGDVPGLFRFRHGMSREVIYESIVLPERRRLHAVALAALEEDSANAPEPARPLELLAYHAAGAGEHVRAARYAELAGDKAAASSSLDRARQHYRNALEWLEREDLTRERRVRWVGIASKLAAASLYRPSPDMPQFIERMRAHSDYLGNLGDVARADYWLGWFHYAFGDQRAAITRYERALQQAREIGDARLESQVLLNLGQSFAAASDYERADEHFSRGLGLKKQALGSGSKPALGVAYSLATRGMMYAEIGQFERAYACAAESIDVVGGTSLPAEAACIASLCLIQMLHGDFRACLDTSARMRALAARIGAHFIFAQNQVVAGYARWVSEHSREGMAEMLHGMRWMETHNLLLFGSFSYAHVADALAAVPEPTAASESALRSLERTARGDPGGEVLAHCVLGRVADLLGAAAEARAHFDKAFACCRERPSPRALALARLRWAECRVKRDAGTETSRALREARTAFRSMKMPFYERQAEELSARIGSGSAQGRLMDESSG